MLPIGTRAWWGLCLKGVDPTKVGPFRMSGHNRTHHARTHQPRTTNTQPRAATLRPGWSQGMMIYARISGVEVVIDDEKPGTIGYTPEYLEDLAHRLGRQAIEMYLAASHTERVTVVDLDDYPIDGDQ